METIMGSVSLILAYLLGSIPFGLIVARLVRGIDIREHGSKNVGATNVFRVVGRPWGILVLVLDALKGYSAVVLCSVLLHSPGHETFIWGVLAGIAAILGHSFPVWLGFRGGKGVATSLGVFLALAWPPTLVTLGLWAFVFLFCRIISVASLSAAVFFPLAVLLFSRQSPGFVYLFLISLLLTGFIFYTHRANIARLKKGEEKRLF